MAAHHLSNLIVCTAVAGVLVLINGLPVADFELSASDCSAMSTYARLLAAFGRGRKIELLGGKAMDARS